MDTSINLFVERIAASRARSFLVYQCDMWLQHNLKVSLRRNKPLGGVLSRHSLRGSLRCPCDTVGRSPLAREHGAAGLPAPNASHRRVRPAIPKNKFLEVS
ncbi:MAG: hypothetical protein Q7T21_04330 [Gallionella sp.]|nr:hypothetical protein [Gallionella sp.]